MVSNDITHQILPSLLFFSKIEAKWANKMQTHSRSNLHTIFNALPLLSDAQKALTSFLDSTWDPTTLLVFLYTSHTLIQFILLYSEHYFSKIAFPDLLDSAKFSYCYSQGIWTQCIIAHISCSQFTDVYGSLFTILFIINIWTNLKTDVPDFHLFVSVLN